jgi:serine/threonine protein kinase
MAGSPLFMSPEQLQGLPYKLTVDSWSLGAILYELCTGKPPFPANALGELVIKVVQ